MIIPSSYLNNQFKRQAGVKKPVIAEENRINKTLEGVLINNRFHKDELNADFTDFGETEKNLFIYENSDENAGFENEQPEKKSFDVKKAMTPLFVAAGCTVAAIFGLSAITGKASTRILNTGINEHLPDLALNMNIRQEPHFATYRMLRDPSFKNILGAGAVFAFSGLTLLGRNFLSATKDIWVKKRQADIERDLRENLIDVEAKAFSGKLNVINNMLGENMKYFKRVLAPKHLTYSAAKPGRISFKNVQGDKKSPDDKKQSLLYGAAALGVCIAGFFAGKYAYKTLKNTLNAANNYTNRYTERILNTVEEIAKKGEKTPEVKNSLSELFQASCAKPDYIRETMTRMNFLPDEIDVMIKGCEESRRTIFADAPTALGGIPKKIQYYCYLDENRGHLYNWVLNPENKFTKYIFLSFTAVSMVGSVVECAFDMLKTVGVERENAKTELNLKKRLVDVEIRNFKAKKESAIKPLRDDFDRRLAAGESKRELKQNAENILSEIKNGPPYVYS